MNKRMKAMAPPQACLLLFVLLVSLASVSVQASFMAIDLGSEFLKVSLIKPGRTPIAIVVNEMSKRKTPALVGFANGERFLGEEAASMSGRYPETVYSRGRDLLGKSADDPAVRNLLQEHNLPYKIVAHPTRGVASVQVKEGTIYSAEELVGSTLQYARQIAEAQSGGPVVDAVIAVPAYFGQTQRQALLDAANLVGINVMGLINTHTAAALQFGIERDFANVTKHVIYYDMGSGSTIVSLVRYSSYNTKDGGKAKPISQLEVRDVDWDAELGANSLDALLAIHFTNLFADKHKIPVNQILSNPKSMAKMRKQVRRTKEMLSANTGGPFSVEEFYDGRDFQASITREELEKMAAPFFARVAAPLTRVLERSGLKPEELDFVELLGGGTRVPGVQAVLQAALGGRALDRHLDADEAVVLGASLFAANLSTSFRLRKFGMADLSLYGISLSIDEAHEGTIPATEAVETPAKPDLRNLLPTMKKLPVKRVVHWTNLSADPLRVSLAYNETTPYGLPPGTKAPGLMDIHVTGINTVIKRYNSSGTVNLKFQASYDGILRLDSAEATVEYISMEEKIVEVKAGGNGTTGGGVNGTASGNSTSSGEEGASGEGEGTEGGEGKTAADGEEAAASEKKEGDEEGGSTDGEKAEAGVEGEGSSSGEKETGKGDESKGGEEGEKGTVEDSGVKAGNETVSAGGAAANKTGPASVVKRIMVPKKKTAKVTLNVTTTWAHPPLSGDDLAAAKATVAGWVADEEARRDTAAAKNELEAYILKMREAVDPDGEGDEKLKKVTTINQRGSFMAALSDAEEWLYMDGESEAAPAFRSKLKELTDVGHPMTRRAEEFERRPQILSAARKEVDLKLVTAKLWEETKPWISPEEREEAIAKVEGYQAWLKEREEAQSKVADHEEPAVTSEEVAREYEKMDKAFAKIANKKKPKPPPEPAANTTTDGTNSTDSSNGTDSATKGANSGSEGSEGKPSSEDQEQGSKTDAPSSSSKGEDSKKKQESEDKKKKKEADEAKKNKEAEDKLKKEAKEALGKLKKDAEAKAKKDKEAKAKADKSKKGDKGKSSPPPAGKDKKAGSTKPASSSSKDKKAGSNKKTTEL